MKTSPNPQALIANQPLMRPASQDERLQKGRRAHHKVKTGCRACKARHQKCDEQHPICSGCARYSTKCIYQGTKSLRLVSDSNLSIIVDPRREIATAPSHELNLDDLELLHHYLTSTCMTTGQKLEITSHIQSTRPKLGQKYPFVMRGMLAMAATHLSRLRPTSQPRYAIMAARHQSASLSDFRAALPLMDQENYQALVFYAKSLVWCSFAAEGEAAESSSANNSKSWLPRWFWLLHGSCQLAESARPWIDSGSDLFYESNRHIDEVSPSPDDEKVESIMNQALCQIGPNKLCKSVFSYLREAFARSSMKDTNTPLRTAMNTWIGSLSNSYIELLHAEEPWALVALACFCVLVHRSETVWFMKGHAQPLLLSILDRLDVSWSSCVEWPICELGLDGVLNNPRSNKSASVCQKK